MYNIKIKLFARTVRQEINRISVSLKQMEFKILRMRGWIKNKLREDIQELKRTKDAILQRLYVLTAQKGPDELYMQAIRADIAMLHDRCRQLKTQY
jgi:hypothetical protein